MALAATSNEIAKAKRLWEANALPIDTICRQVGRSPPWLYHHMRKEGWEPRPRVEVKIVKQAKAKGRTCFYGGAWAAQQRKEVQSAERKRYGPLLADVQLLRRRGFAVNCEGEMFRVGNALVDARELQAKAARERRLLNGKDRIHV